MEVKILKKLLVGALLIGSFNTAFIDSENTASAAEVSEPKVFTPLALPSQVSEPNLLVAATATKPVIWAHPSKAKEIGKTFSTNATITRTELIRINTYFDNKETGEAAQLGIATTVLTAPLNTWFSISAGVGVTMLTSYVSTQGKIVNNTLLKSTKSKFNVKISYAYRQAGSNDGYYYITKITISEK